MPQVKCRTLALALAILGASRAVTAASWTAAGDMATGRWGHAAAWLRTTGDVLVFGGGGTPERFDWLTTLFSPTGPQKGGGYSSGMSATPLQDGRVLVISGTMAEVYDPATGTFTATGSPIDFHSSHTATRLPDGRVLVVGGHFYDGPEHGRAEIYDPATGTFGRTGSLQIARMSHAAVGLADGRVVIFGGLVITTPGYGRSLASIEVYSPATGTFTLGASLSAPASSVQATLLPDGTVLVYGGDEDAVDIYDPSNGRVTPVARPSPSIGRYGFTTTPLRDGRVLFAGGYRWDAGTTAAAELYWPVQRRFTTTAAMSTARASHTATLLRDGRVLVTGGSSAAGAALASSELYRPLPETPPPAQAPLPPLPKGGRISGVVRSASTSRPLAGVLVKVYSSAGGSVTFGKTDAAGRWISDESLPTGSYYARTENLSGYVDEVHPETVCTGCRVDLTGQPIPVFAGFTTPGIDFSLAIGARIAGTVRDTAGRPIPFAVVQFYQADGRTVTFAHADVEGRYMSEAGFPAGSYFARATGWAGYVDELWNGIACPGFCDVTSGTPISVLLPLIMTGFDFTLAETP